MAEENIVEIIQELEAIRIILSIILVGKIIKFIVS